MAMVVLLLVEGGEDYFALNSVLIMGEAEISEDPEVVAENQRIVDETKPIYRDQLTPDKWPPHLEKFYQKPRAAIKVVSRNITTWDFAKIPR